MLQRHVKLYNLTVKHDLKFVATIRLSSMSCRVTPEHGGEPEDVPLPLDEGGERRDAVPDEVVGPEDKNVKIIIFPRLRGTQVIIQIS